ncbi:GntR family transcriptional regulator [bacterium]|nr:GntR family transcriptional regulator [bacterium]
METKFKIDEVRNLPKYFQLKQILLTNINNGTYSNDGRLPLVRNLMSKHNLSFSTVDNALRELVNEGIIYCEHGKGIFVKNPDLVSDKKIKTIGLIVSNLSKNQARNEILEGIEKILSDRGYSLTLRISERDVKKEKELLESFNKDNTSGVLIFPVAVERTTALRNFLSKHIPIVLVDRYFPHLASVIDYVVSDNEGGAYKAVEYLIKLGHKKIAHITGLHHYTSIEDRIKGYKKALLDNKIKVDEALIKRGASTENWVKVGYNLTSQLFEDNTKFTAIFANNDSTAIGAIKAIKENGLNVPEDISVIGFDDNPQASLLEVPLTTVAQLRYDIGTKAAQILLDKIEGKLKAPQHVVLKTKLIIRKSCALRSSLCAKKERR